MTETLLLALILVPCLVVAIVFHEVAHGWAALALGDPTAKEKRRLSLNPVRHVDPVGTLVVPGALALFGGPIFGWAKPVPVRQDRLDNPRFGMMAVAAAGPATNLALALAGATLAGLVAGFAFPGEPPAIVMTAMGYFVLINVFLALFNLLPIPPFDGSHIVGGLLPRRYARHWQRAQAMGMALIFVLIALTWAFPGSGVVESVVLPPVLWMQNLYFTYADAVAQLVAG
ncbi:site-2 protease family protein [Aurantiacibacter spongiae]|uniref:Site-2 protease family protein n=1 Tax=Aurantiacibacter spongiae TaxID=2488860 RepID=A0A3N5DSE5_9SPHN|nr:site-2 protease family protein [Aurantiacibacter spongiae]RPF72131.1 site-2 protease family protein [Aurantiacibacter spongiae]